MGLRDYIAANEEAEADHSAVIPLFPLLPNTNGEGIVMLPASNLHDFNGHTFKMRPDDDPYILSLQNSIKENGILTPLLVRPHPTLPGEYEIIAGHTRKHLGVKCGLTELPCTIKHLDNDDAIIQMGETNVQRPGWLPSEKAKTYAAHLDATRRKTGIAQGNRTDLTSPNRSAKFRNDDEAAKTWGISGDKLRMYIKLNALLPNLLNWVDEGRVSVKSGYQLAFLTPENQQTIMRVMQEHSIRRLTDSKARELRQFGEDGELTIDYILRVLEIQKPQQAEVRHVSISFETTELLNKQTTRTALNDPAVLEAIEQILIDYAKKHGLPLR